MSNILVKQSFHQCGAVFYIPRFECCFLVLIINILSVNVSGRLPSLLLDEYLTQENLRLLDTIAPGPASSASSAPSLSSALVVVGADKTAELKQTTINRNQAILQMCLHMEGLAKFARVSCFIL